jgi:hypothetical protein
MTRWRRGTRRIRFSVFPRNSRTRPSTTVRLTVTTRSRKSTSRRSSADHSSGINPVPTANTTKRPPLTQLLSQQVDLGPGLEWLYLAAMRHRILHIPRRVLLEHPPPHRLLQHLPHDGEDLVALRLGKLLPPRTKIPRIHPIQPVPPNLASAFASAHFTTSTRLGLLSYWSRNARARS